MISNLGVGEALISTLDEKGVPSIVEKTLMSPPRSQFGPITEDERKKIVDRSPVKSRYGELIDRESAYELLKKREQELIKRREQQAKKEAAEKQESRSKRSSGSRRQGVGEAFAKSIARAIGSKLGKQIIRGILGSIMGGKS